jgi:hypothetical protein
VIPGWKEDILSAYLCILRQYPGATPAEVAAHLRVSEGCAIYWLTDLARDGRIRIGSVELVENGASQAESEGLSRGQGNRLIGG